MDSYEGHEESSFYIKSHPDNISQKLWEALIITKQESVLYVDNNFNVLYDI
ncbi:hypothetical protein [Mesomycoplasma neurolyticum]|uniref:Uncharacterized protein n=1 Tax=Mesomycoplasma neurolyticum TaxID=2120 RepID=A0A449A648_9BACT|nr:hypothetical protein [Mesomycoplasma neurolyticum]VEU59699.1 Uncharacterised protein [Mesomycoplasma neurolyticum]